MKLKPNCIRDLLEVFESEIQDANCTYNFPSWESFQEYPALEKYTVEEIAYHCQQLYLSGFFYHGELYCDGGISLMDIMPEAHALLANLRIPKTFQLLQKFISLSGSASINQMAEITTSATMEFLPSLLNFAQDILHKSLK